MVSTFANVFLPFFSNLIFLPFFILYSNFARAGAYNGYVTARRTADSQVGFAIDFFREAEANVGMAWLNLSRHPPVPVAQVEEHRLRNPRLPVHVLVGTVAPSFQLSQMLGFPSFNKMPFIAVNLLRELRVSAGSHHKTPS